jgi:archaellum biogenesis ATPase FlaH
VCGVPGANAWPEDADRILRDARRVFIGTDPDDTGRKAAEKIAEHVGARARILPWPEQLLARPAADGLQPKDIDWTALKVGYGLAWQDVAALMHESAGRRLLSMAEAGARLRTRPKDGGIRIGFSDIDSWLAPGLLPGQLMIPLAKTGTGKTVFLCNIAHANRHRHVLFITLEMTAEEVYDRMTRIHRFAAPHATTDDVETALARILICDENRLGERDLAELVDEYEYQTGARPDLLLLDYLGYYARGAQGGSPYEKTSNAVMQLKAEAKRHRLAVIAPHQVNRGATDGRPIDSSDARDSGVVEETADFLLAIYRPDEALTVNGQPTGRLKLSILKSRHGNRDRVASVQMGVLSLAMVDATSPLAKAAQDEAYLVSQGTTYDTYLRNRTAPVQKELL